MERTPFDDFGENASVLSNFAEIAGRYSFQRQAEQYLLYYLLEKLSLSPKDDLLDIGCGAGNVLIPLSFFVHSITGIDHPNLIAQIKDRVPKDHDTMTLIPGEFPTTEVPGIFSRIVIYSVIHYLRTEDEVLQFIRAAVLLLQPGGKMLIGDIPNKDLKARFLDSEQGKRFAAEWQEKVEREQKINPNIHTPLTETPLVAMDDALVEKMLATLEGMHLHARRIRQPDTMSFSHTREDIIIEKE